MFKNVKRIHCLGVGGIGVSALAELLHKQGFEVSGSDLAENGNTDRLEKMGVKIFIGHYSGNIAGADLVIYSSAVGIENPEYKAALDKNIPLIMRGEALGNLMENREVVAITGSHGKTTTTAILSEILLQAKADPAIAAGGVLTALDSPARYGQGKYFIAEGDESDGSFLFLNPTYAIVTSIDPDHLENYHDRFENLQNTFVQFLNKTPKNGCAVLFLDDQNVATLLPQLKCNYLTYGFGENADCRVTEFKQTDWASEFVIQNKKSGVRTAVKFNLPGKHNALNATAACIVAQQMGISISVIQAALAKFKGVARRFQCHGEIKDTKIKLLEDYGHHPKEIAETIKAIRQLWPNKKIRMIFQPHRFTRTKALFDEFVEVLQHVDDLYLIDIYEASELPNGVTTEMLAEAIVQSGFEKACYVADRYSLPSQLKADLKADDVVVLQGAGDIGALRKAFL